MTKTTWEKSTSKGGKAYLGFQFEERASFTVGNSWPQKHVAVAHIHRRGQVGLDDKLSRPPPSGCLPSAMLDLKIPQPCETQSPAGIWVFKDMSLWGVISPSKTAGRSQYTKLFQPWSDFHLHNDQWWCWLCIYISHPWRTPIQIIFLLTCIFFWLMLSCKVFFKIYSEHKTTLVSFLIPLPENLREQFIGFILAQVSEGLVFGCLVPHAGASW